MKMPRCARKMILMWLAWGGLLGCGSLAAQTELVPVCVESEDSLTFQVGEQTLLEYHKTLTQPPAGIEPVYRRSGYLHPIRTPGGRIVTGDYAPDHAHQHGLFTAWVQTRFEDQQVDFWNQKKRLGQVEHSRVLKVQNTDAWSEFQVELIHSALLERGPVPVLRETWQLRAYPQLDQSWVFDLESNQTCIAKTPLTLEQYHYGGLGLRGSSQWFRKDAAKKIQTWKQSLKKSVDPPATRPEPPGVQQLGHGMITNLGKRRHDGNHTPAKWVAMFGPLGDGQGGIAILGHPDNLRAPQTVRLHPHKPYFAYTPVVHEAYQLNPNATLQSRYRIIAFDGELDADWLDRQWREYSSN